MSDAENSAENGGQQQQEQQQGDSLEDRLNALEAENKALQELLGSHKAQLEKRDGLVKKLRKTEAQAGKFDAIIADVMGAMKDGVSEGFLNVISDLSVEKQYSLLKEYRPAGSESEAEPKPKPKEEGPHVKYSDGAARPKAEPLDSAYDREKEQLKAAGRWNPSTAKMLAVRHSEALKTKG